MHGLFESPIANLPPQPRPVSADRYSPLSTFRPGKGKEAQRAAYDGNDDIAKNPGREEREGVVEQTHQDSKNETEDFVGSEGEKDKWMIITSSRAPRKRLSSAHAG
jgi:hypothetical protein